MQIAHGQQQNDISRYLNSMGDGIRDRDTEFSNKIQDVLSQLSTLRSDLRRERVHARVLPDGTVQLSSGEIVDGIRGNPAPGNGGVSAVSPSASHVQGHVTPDGTVMVGDKIVDGVKGSPRPPTEADIAEEKKRAQETRAAAAIDDILSRRKKIV